MPPLQSATANGLGLEVHLRSLFVLGFEREVWGCLAGWKQALFYPQLGGETGNRMQEVSREVVHQSTHCSPCLTPSQVSGQSFADICDMPRPYYEVYRLNPI